MKLDSSMRCASTFLSTSNCTLSLIIANVNQDFSVIRYLPLSNYRCAANELFLQQRLQFLPRCIECRRGLAMRILSVRRSVCRTRGFWQNGRKICPDFYTMRM